MRKEAFSYIEDMTARKFSYNFKNIILLRLTAAPGPTVHAVQRQRWQFQTENNQQKKSPSSAGCKNLEQCWLGQINVDHRIPF